MPQSEIKDQIKEYIPDLKPSGGAPLIPPEAFQGMGSAFKQIFKEVIVGIKKSLSYMGKKRKW